MVSLFGDLGHLYENIVAFVFYLLLLFVLVMSQADCSRDNCAVQSGVPRKSSDWCSISITRLRARKEGEEQGKWIHFHAPETKYMWNSIWFCFVKVWFCTIVTHPCQCCDMSLDSKVGTMAREDIYTTSMFPVGNGEQSPSVRYQMVLVWCSCLSSLVGCGGGMVSGSRKNSSNLTSKSTSFTSVWGGWLGRDTKRTSCIIPTLQYVNKREFVKSGVCEGLHLRKEP